MGNSMKHLLSLQLSSLQVRMKTVRIIGGLGNQMFQYALIVGLQESFKEDVYADISGFKKYNLHNGLEIESIFGVKLQIINKCPLLARKLTLSRYINKFLPFLCRRYQFEYPDFRYIEGIYQNKEKEYYAGYWHHHRYLESFRDDLCQIYHFPPFEDQNNKMISIQMRRENSVGIHVRRGDYLDEKQYQGICTLDYYKKAIEIVHREFGNVSFYVFSNDVAWCRANLSDLFADSKATYIDWNKGKDSYRDMQLMTFCRGLIIANSSFSWWGAFLNMAEDRLVIAPKKWKNTDYNLEIQLPEWNLI